MLMHDHDAAAHTQILISRNGPWIPMTARRAGSYQLTNYFRLQDLALRSEVSVSDARA